MMNLKEISKKLFKQDFSKGLNKLEALRVINNQLMGPVYVKHLKTSNLYKIDKIVLNCTNKDDGEFMIEYHSSNGGIFVRESGEFFEKFELI